MVLAKNTSEEEIKELSKWKKVENTGTTVTLKRFIENREVISKTELMKLWGKSTKTIQRYISDNMPIHEKSSRAFQIFDIEKVVSWRDGNIDKTMSIKTSALGEIEKSSKDLSADKTSDIERKLKADADDAELKVKLNTIKLAEAEGRVVDANDLDRAMSELAIVHKTDKIHDENLLPVILENKDAGEIKTLLQDHNHERLAMLDKIINKEFKSKETMYDIVEATLHQLKDGVEPESIVKRIKGSLI